MQGIWIRRDGGGQIKVREDLTEKWAFVKSPERGEGDNQCRYLGSISGKGAASSNALWPQHGWYVWEQQGRQCGVAREVEVWGDDEGLWGQFKDLECSAGWRMGMQGVGHSRALERRVPWWDLASWFEQDPSLCSVGNGGQREKQGDQLGCYRKPGEQGWSPGQGGIRESWKMEIDLMGEESTFLGRSGLPCPILTFLLRCQRKLMVTTAPWPWDDLAPCQFALRKPE